MGSGIRTEALNHRNRPRHQQLVTNAIQSQYRWIHTPKTGPANAWRAREPELESPILHPRMNSTLGCGGSRPGLAREM